jgi:putative copper resistance protein D
VATALTAGRGRRVVFHPLALWVLYTASLFGLYLLPVYRVTRSHLVLLDCCHLEFALAGCLYIWPLVGADLAVGRIGQGWRIAWLGLGIPFYSVFGMAMLSVTTTVAPGIGVNDVHAGGDILWSTGEVISVAGMAALLVSWLFSELRRVREEEAIDQEALDLQASMWRVSRILAKTDAEKAAERAAALAAYTVPARSRTSGTSSDGPDSDDEPDSPVGQLNR